MSFEFNNTNIPDIQDVIISEVQSKMFMHLWYAYDKEYIKNAEWLENRLIKSDSWTDPDGYFNNIKRNCNMLTYEDDSHIVRIKSTRTYEKLICMFATYQDTDFSGFKYKISSKTNILELPYGLMAKTNDYAWVCKTSFSTSEDRRKVYSENGYPIKLNVPFLKRMLLQFIPNISFLKLNEIFVLGPDKFNNAPPYKRSDVYNSSLIYYKFPNWKACQFSLGCYYDISTEELLELVRIGTTVPRLYYTHMHMMCIINTLVHNKAIDDIQAEMIFEAVSRIINMSLVSPGQSVNAMAAGMILENIIADNTSNYMVLHLEYSQKSLNVLFNYDDIIQTSDVKRMYLSYYDEKFTSPEYFRDYIVKIVNEMYKKHGFNFENIETSKEAKMTYTFTEFENSCIEAASKLFASYPVSYLRK